MQPRYVIGIDLGTTNCALAYAEIREDADPFAPAGVQLMGIPQLVNAGEVRDGICCRRSCICPGRTICPRARLIFRGSTIRILPSASLPATMAARCQDGS